LSTGPKRRVTIERHFHDHYQVYLKKKKEKENEFQCIYPLFLFLINKYCFRETVSNASMSSRRQCHKDSEMLFAFVIADFPVKIFLNWRKYLSKDLCYHALTYFLVNLIFLKIYSLIN